MLNVLKKLDSPRVDLMQLVEEAVDGCWIGHRARTAELRDSGIGSVYSPPHEDRQIKNSPRRHVETIVDIGFRQGVRRNNNMHASQIH